MKKRFLTVLLTLSIAMSLTPMWVLADEVEMKEAEYRAGAEAESGDDLLLKAFYGDEALQPQGEIGITPSYNTLNPYQQNLYNRLRRWIQDINMTDIDASTEYTFQLNSVSEASMMWDYALDNDNFDAVANCLISDLPSDLYWYNRHVRASQRGTEITIWMGVGLEYRAYGNEFMVSGAQIRRAHDAIENVVDAVLYVKNLTDYEKLTFYCSLICNLVDYNHDAIAPDFDVEKNDPWQFVYVFDMDSDTNVVCEGYSKAFQLLCDLTDWEDGSIQCFTVSGTMDGGRHMWNIVQIQGQNYLVDVTNCDDGAYGYPDKLFLVGGNGSVSGGYYPICSDSWVSRVLYRYDSPYADASILRLSSRNYVPSAQLYGTLTILDDGVPADTSVEAVPGKVLEARYEPAPGEPSGPISYQWYVNGYPIDYETEPTFVFVGGEAGYNFSVRVTINGASMTSGIITAYAPPPPLSGNVEIHENSLDGENVAGKSVEYSSGKILRGIYELGLEDEPGSVAFQWLCDGKEISGETKNVLTLQSRYIDHTISLRVTMNGSSLTSAPVSIVEAPGLHGKITVSATFPSEADGTTYTIGGETVTLHAIPDAGYKVGSLQVITTSGTTVPLSQNGNDYSFVMPTSDVTVQVKFVRI